MVVGTVIHRVRALAGTPVGGVGQLGPQQVAYLNGGDRPAIWTVLGGLRRSGAVGVQSDRRLTTGGPMPAGATPLDQAIHNAAGRHVLARELRRDRVRLLRPARR